MKGNYEETQFNNTTFDPMQIKDHELGEHQNEVNEIPDLNFDETPLNGVKISAIAEYEATSEELLEYLAKSMKRYEETYIIRADQQPSLSDLLIATNNWQRQYTTLCSNQVLTAWEESKAKDAYNEYLSSKIVEVREQYNNANIEKKFWMSITEIENQTKTRFRHELSYLKVKWEKAIREKAIADKILEGWNMYSYQLQSMIKASSVLAQIDLKLSGMDFNPRD